MAEVETVHGASMSDPRSGVAAQGCCSNSLHALINAPGSGHGVTVIATLSPVGEIVLQRVISADPQGLPVCMAELVLNLGKRAQHLVTLGIEVCLHIPSVPNRYTIDLQSEMHCPMPVL